MLPPRKKKVTKRGRFDPCFRSRDHLNWVKNTFGCCVPGCKNADDKIGDYLVLDGLGFDPYKPQRVVLPRSANGGISGRRRTAETSRSDDPGPTGPGTANLIRQSFPCCDGPRFDAHCVRGKRPAKRKNTSQNGRDAADGGCQRIISDAASLVRSNRATAKGIRTATPKGRLALWLGRAARQRPREGVALPHPCRWAAQRCLLPLFRRQQYGLSQTLLLSTPPC